MGAPLEDARHLAQRYDRMRQEAEAQVFFYCFNSTSVWNAQNFTKIPCLSWVIFFLNFVLASVYSILRFPGAHKYEQFFMEFIIYQLLYFF